MVSFPGGPTSISGIVESWAESDRADYTSAHADVPTPSTATPSVDNCLIIYFAAGNQLRGAASFYPNSSTELFVYHEYDGTFSDLTVWASYAIQTTAESVGASSFDLASTDTLRSKGVVVALKGNSATTKYLKLLAHSSAASAADVEGVVLNAARDTVIGEFTGQAFEASLEGSPGEAVLLIDVADITPDGDTLTTSDTPIVFAYNATDSIVGPGSATVIEV